jgi:predicted Zn-dependent protease
MRALALVTSLVVGCAPRLVLPPPNTAATVKQLDADRAELERHRLACASERSRAFSPAEVVELGERASQRWLGSQGVLRATKGDARLSRLVMLVTKDPTLHALAVSDDAIDAFSAPPATVFVTTGALAQLSDEALAGVIAHEVAHLRHADALAVARRRLELRCLTRLMAQTAVTAVATTPRAGDAPPLTLDAATMAALADELVEALMTTGFGAQQQGGPAEEYAADALAAQLLRRAGVPLQPWLGSLERFEHAAVVHPTAADRRARVQP